MLVPITWEIMLAQMADEAAMWKYYADFYQQKHGCSDKERDEMMYDLIEKDRLKRNLFMCGQFGKIE